MGLERSGNMEEVQVLLFYLFSYSLYNMDNCRTTSNSQNLIILHTHMVLHGVMAHQLLGFLGLGCRRGVSADAIGVRAVGTCAAAGSGLCVPRRLHTRAQEAPVAPASTRGHTPDSPTPPYPEQRDQD